MIKLIICMGNSYKHGGRCLAGIEVTKTSSGYSVVANHDGSPRWIRPVMANGDDGLPEWMVGSFKKFDVLEVDVTGSVPTGAHSENVRFDEIRKVGSIGMNAEILSALCDNSHSLIFGNRGKAVPKDVFNAGGYSLMFVKPENLHIETQYDEYGHEKYRIQFSYRGNRYDLPLTDPEYISKLQNGHRDTGDRFGEDLYLTLSLGTVHFDWHYKLVAGVVDLAA